MKSTKTSDSEQILSSLALDLKRIALGLHKKSYVMAEKFTQEALQRKKTNISKLKPYMQKVLVDLEHTLRSVDVDQKAESAFMYSTLIQNYVLKDQVRS